MELTPLRYFIQVAGHAHMTRAAQSLGVTQPALSAAIRRLEDEVGAELFHRTAKGVRLTDAGRTFLDYAEAAVQQADAGASAVREIVGLSRGQIRVGGGATAAGYLLPSVIKEFRARHPSIHLYLREAASRDVARAVRNAELDMGLVTLPLHAEDEGDLIVIAKRRDELRLAVPPDHRLASRKTFRWSDIEREPIIAFEAGSAIRRVIDDAASQHQATLNVVMELRAIDIIIRMVRASVGLAFVSALALDGDTLSDEDPPTGLSCKDSKITRTLALVRRADFTPSPAMQAFEELLKYVLSGSPNKLQ